MADRKITDESLAAVLRYCEKERRFGTAHLFKMLTVPVQEPEGWVEVTLMNQGGEYVKGEYYLGKFPDSWQLYEVGRKIAVLINVSHSKTLQEAQAWADAIIKERKVGEKKKLPPICNYCMVDLPKWPVYYRGDAFCDKKCATNWIVKQSQTQPFGPGSEFVMPNGDLVRVVGNGPYVCAVNLTSNTIHYAWKTPNALRAALEAAGAKAV